MDDSSQEEEFHLGIDTESENEYIAEEEEEKEEGWSRFSNRKRFCSTSSSDLDEVVTEPREGNNTPRVSLEINSPSPVARVESEEGERRGIGLQDVLSEDEQERERKLAPIDVRATDERSVPSSSEAGPVSVASTCFCGGGSRSGMIKCGSCGGSYHSDCVGVTRQRAALLEQFHCPSCMSQDPSLVTVFREEGEGGGEEGDEPVERTTGPRKRTSNMCGVLSWWREGRGCGCAGGERGGVWLCWWREGKGCGCAGGERECWEREGRGGEGREMTPLLQANSASIVSCKS